ncbi:DUF116 domain-containing protein [Chitinispirillales bacterium ANBcel5]|uniref:DUF116 domain-containing protein n=1 Tax=Cellulosispirillum alkaliphilum TaxID=3039283 RepID=UPI002A584335|nr:DUF116 domain-containing protein [Chitinispirillales bacterium ANBcel5]
MEQNQTAILNRQAIGNESAWRRAWRKLPFLGFCWASLITYAAVLFLILYLIQPRLQTINPVLNSVTIALFSLMFLIPSGGLSLITITALSGIDLLYPHRKKSVTVRLLFPIAIFIGEMLRVNRNTLRVSFVKVNNALTLAQSKRIRGERVLILLPHCLQIDVCNRKITNDINNCINCARCHVGSLVELGQKHGIKIEVVNGGTLARRRIVQFRPDGIIAVACERDLTLGILDAYPIPVYGVINDRPYGPCHNTCVDMSLVEEAVKFFESTQKASHKPSAST